MQHNASSFKWKYPIWNWKRMRQKSKNYMDKFIEDFLTNVSTK